MAKKQQIIKTLTAVFLILLIVKCASQIAPPGGDKDITPPVVIETYPEDGTTNFKDNIIEFTFSEYVNKRNINEAFFISPLIKTNPEMSWTNRTVEMTFPDGFDSNTTYSVIIGTAITDVNNNNNMLKPFVLTFSTGDKIDSGMISGRVFSEKSDGTLIFAYLDTDSLNIYKQKPNYISQIDDKGRYKLSGLGIEKYKIFAVKDEFKDLVYSIGEDKIGVQFKDTFISDSSKSITDINFFLQKEDTLAPNIQSVTMTDKNHIIVEFNESIDSSRLSSKNFIIYDSTNNTGNKIHYLYKGNNSKHQYIVTVSDSLNSDNNIYLNVSRIFDKYGNELVFESKSFTPSDKPDTNAVRINRINSPLKSGIIDYLNPEFDVLFTDAFDTTKAKRGILFFDKDSNKIPINMKFLDNATVKIKPLIELKPRASYKFVTVMKYFIDEAGNKIDTTISNRVSTVNNLDFSGASGKVNFNKTKNIRIVLESAERDKRKIEKVINDDKTFNFERVLPGEYLIWAYEDSDSNKEYSYGSVIPFVKAEYFKYYPDTLNLRARWPVGDIFIDFNK